MNIQMDSRMTRIERIGRINLFTHAESALISLISVIRESITNKKPDQ